jgi:hypothetical protein
MAFPRVSFSLTAAPGIPTTSLQPAGLMVLSEWFASNRLQGRIAPGISRSQWERTFGAQEEVTTFWNPALRPVPTRGELFDCCCGECCIGKLPSTSSDLCDLDLLRQCAVDN